MRKRKNTPEGVDEKLARVLRANFTQDELCAGLRSQLDEFIKESKVERIFGLRGDLKKFRDKSNSQSHNGKFLLGEVR